MTKVNALYIVILLYAAYKDYKTFKIEDRVNVGILLLSMIEITKFPLHLLGAVLLTAPFLYLGIKKDAFGGGDIKFIFSNGCMIGLGKNYIAIFICFLLVVLVGRMKKICKKDVSKRIALAPYLVAGYLIVLLFRKG